jgi:ubiquinone/menaquinone biosynthesis C-methylase UbiE
VLPSPEAISDDSLKRLHSDAIEGAPAIRELLLRAQRGGAVLESRLNLGLDRQTAVIETVGADHLLLATRNFDADQPEQIFLNVDLDGRRYFFAVVRRDGPDAAGRMLAGLPATVFHTERRDRERSAPGSDPAAPRRVVLRAAPAPEVQAEVADFSADGLLVDAPEAEARVLPESLRVSFLDGGRSGQEMYAVVAHRRPDARRAGWVRIGLSTSQAPRGRRLPVERRDAILQESRAANVRRRWRLASAGARVASVRSLRSLARRQAKLPEIHLLDLHDDRGERLRGILDAHGDVRGAPLVLIPPAWAKTKETLLPLARTIVATFRRAGERVAVVRLDGIRRRGESHNDPECLTPGRECHHMTFSQGTRDIQAAVDHFARAEAFRPSSILLVTFSGAAIEARRALAAQPRQRVGGWISVVGAADLKSGLRTVSGGVDYIGGSERGVRFGIQRILGIEVDMDRVAADALANDLAHLEHARRDMAAIDVPITWIQGRYDAWIDPARVAEILSCGGAGNRRLLDVPTGHQLRSSREALETFQLIAQEVGRVALGRELSPEPPDLADLEARRTAERARLPKAEVDLKSFWRDYLLGRDRRLGMEILTATRPYRELMSAQIRALDPKPGARIADLGSGTGAFPLQLLAERPDLARVRIDEIDYVPEALARARERLSRARAPQQLEIRFLECDLDLAEGGAVPAPDGGYDAVVASLLLNYVKDPSRLLREARRLLRPGGRLVLSTLRRDADISRIYRDVSQEVLAGGALGSLGVPAGSGIEASLADFLNEAARLIDLEERGVFHFWDADELAAHLGRAGFANVATATAFGDPPQAIVASASRP